MKMILAVLLATSTLALAGTAAEAASTQPASKTAVAKHHHRHAAHVAPKRHRHVVRTPAYRCQYRCGENVARDDRYDWTKPFRLEPVGDEPAPTQINNYYDQKSVYDFAAGKRANIKEYND